MQLNVEQVQKGFGFPQVDDRRKTSIIRYGPWTRHARLGYYYHRSGCGCGWSSILDRARIVHEVWCHLCNIDQLGSFFEIEVCGKICARSKALAFRSQVPSAFSMRIHDRAHWRGSRCKTIAALVLWLDQGHKAASLAACATLPRSAIVELRFEVASCKGRRNRASWQLLKIPSLYMNSAQCHGSKIVKRRGNCKEVRVSLRISRNK
jgi:hypothetical protein